MAPDASNFSYMRGTKQNVHLKSRRQFYGLGSSTTQETSLDSTNENAPVPPSNVQFAEVGPPEHGTGEPPHTGLGLVDNVTRLIANLFYDSRLRERNPANEYHKNMYARA